MVNWEAVSAIGQIVSGLAVVISLIYLAIEVRQNTAVVKAATSQNLAETALRFSTTLGAETGLAHLFNRGLAGASGLTESEQAQFTYLFHAWVRVMENGHFQFHSGLLDDQLWQGWTETARSFLAAPGGQQMWRSVKPRVRREFREYIERDVLPSATAGASKNFLHPSSD